MSAVLGYRLLGADCFKGTGILFECIEKIYNVFLIKTEILSSRRIYPAAFFI